MTIDLDKVKSYVPEISNFHYNSRDAIIYALSIGSSVQDNLNFLYEGHSEFQIFPTFVVAPGLLINSTTLGDWPGLNFDLTRVLHGEQYIEFFDVLPTEDTDLHTSLRVLDVLDKGSGVVIITEASTYDESGRLLALQQFSFFQKGKSNFVGLNRSSGAEHKMIHAPIDREPDASFSERIGLEQCALYRMGGGDLNPLHIDPEFAKNSGFSKPILHGLCSLGIATRLILQNYGRNEAKNLRSVKVRFSSPVLPGETLIVETWKDQTNNNGIHFQAKVLETGKVALSNCYIVLNEKITDINILEKSIGNMGLNDEVLESAKIFTQLKTFFTTANSKNLFDSSINGTIVFDIHRNNKPFTIFTIDIRNGQGKVYRGLLLTNPSHRVTVTMDDKHLYSLITERDPEKDPNPRSKKQRRGKLIQFFTDVLQNKCNGIEKSKI